MAMKILIVNDDGIHAPGIMHLAKWATKLGDVTVIAPKREQSGKSHSINIVDSFEIKTVEFLPDVKAYRVDSSPSDCSRFGILGLKQEYDLVLSGINNGYNMGRDIVYSGTVGAIFEACSLGAKRGLAPANKVGVIDSDYRGEISVVLHNHGQVDQTVAPGERIAQMIITPVLTPAYEEVDELTDTDRGTGGFGSTGK